MRLRIYSLEADEQRAMNKVTVISIYNIEGPTAFWRQNMGVFEKLSEIS